MAGGINEDVYYTRKCLVMCFRVRVRSLDLTCQNVGQQRNNHWLSSAFLSKLRTKIKQNLRRHDLQVCNLVTS